MNAVGLILGGGEGSRLQPLTRDRAKPAVPIGGKYRLVDIPISNCIHSNIRSIFLLTQFNSVSLHQHIQSTYKFDDFQQSFVRILAAQQTPGSGAWYEGTADAVRKTFRYFMDMRPDLVLILSGDQLYRLNFQDVIAQHLEHEADVTICTKPVPREQAGSLGIMQVDKNRQIINFVEKPGDTPALDGLEAPFGDQTRYLASMGIYLFKTSVLSKVLEDESQTDFGKHIIPAAIRQHKVFSYSHEGYWRDIGTIRSFWETNLALTDLSPDFDFYSVDAPIYTRMRYLPPSKLYKTRVTGSMVAEGCRISAASIDNSIIGTRAIIGDDTRIEKSIVMGADYYEKDAPPQGLPALGIGRDCEIRNAIIDKNVRVGDGCSITGEGRDDDEVSDFYAIRDGVIVIPKNTVIPAGTKL